MIRYCAMAFTMVTMTVTTSAFADNAPPAYHEAMIRGGGQADALGVVCGKVSEAQASAHKAELKKMYAAKGVAPVKFEAIYSGGYNNVKASAKANPVGVRQACDRLSKGAMSGG